MLLEMQTYVLQKPKQQSHILKASITVVLHRRTAKLH